MADLPHTMSFKVGTDMRDWLRQVAAGERRKVGDMIRLLLEQQRQSMGGGIR
jgi:hypothetical protein